MKKKLKILFVAILGMVALYYYVASTLVDVADDFFKAIKSDNLVKVESYLSKDFKKNTSRKQLAQYLVGYHLTDYKDLSWGFRRVIHLNMSGQLDGTVTSKDGVESPIHLAFKREDGEWKIFAMEKELNKKEIAEQKAKQKALLKYTTLARVSMHHLGVAIKENNMSKLYENIAEVWKKETTVEDLNKTYGVFIEKKVNLLSLDKVSPRLTVTTLNKKGILTLSGYYLIGKKNAIYFTHKYIAEKRVWRLVGLSIEIK